MIIQPRAIPYRHQGHRYQKGVAWKNKALFGMGYLALNNQSGQGAWIADDPAWDVLDGDLEIICCLALNHTTGKATIDNIITKGNTSTAGVGSWILRKPASVRSLQFNWRESGGTVRSVSITSAFPNVIYRPRWYKFEFDASTATGTVHISDEPPETTRTLITWTLHGSDTDSVATDIALGSADIWIGNRADDPNEYLDGKVYYVGLFDGIGGNLVLEADFRWKENVA